MFGAFLKTFLFSVGQGFSLAKTSPHKAAVAAFLLFFGTTAYASDFAVIVNRNGPLTGITAAEVKSMYLGEKRFTDDTKIMPVNSTEGPLKDVFLKKAVGMNSKEYKLHWIKKVFQDGIPLPVVIGTTADAFEFVKTEKGAIAYVPAELLKDMDKERIAVIGGIADEDRTKK